MTIFRDEIGGFFIVMFVALLTGKVWGWIGEGRIEALEQQPPANPRLFHTRLIISLFLSLVYDAWLLYYAVTTVIDQAKPDMMVMFLFEFAVLLVTSLHTALRYSIILLDTSIIKRQTKERLAERRREIREERAAILRRREEAATAAEAAAAMGQEGGEEAVAAVEAEEDNEPLPDEDDVDEMDIEVAGWEAKGQYILGLDLWTGKRRDHLALKLTGHMLTPPSRLHKTLHLCRVLRRPVEFLRPSSAHHKRPIHDNTVVYQALGGTDEVPPGDQRHEPVR